MKEIMNIQKIEEMFQYDFTMKFEELGKHLPQVRKYIEETIEMDRDEKDELESKYNSCYEQKDCMRETLCAIRKEIDKNRISSNKELEKMKKSELLDMVLRIVSHIDECYADL